MDSLYLKTKEKTIKSQLEIEGWKKKFTIEEQRIDEYVELYKSLGFEVRIELVIPSEMEGCSTCFKENCAKFREIWTRSS